MAGRIRGISLAHYDLDEEPWRARYDRPGVRVRVYYRGYRNSALGRRDYYPSPGVFRLFIQELVWTHNFMVFEAKGEQRISIRNPNVLPNWSRRRCKGVSSSSTAWSILATLF